MPTSLLILMRRTVVERVGGWHPNLPVIQDASFMLDCALQGGSFVYCAGLMAEYRVHESGSVSTRSRSAFLEDCLRNAIEIRDWWVSRGCLDRERRRAVIQVLDSVANGSIGVDGNLLNRACEAVELLRRENPPDWPLKKKIAIGLLGYRFAIVSAARMPADAGLLSAGETEGAGSSPILCVE